MTSPLNGGELLSPFNDLSASQYKRHGPGGNFCSFFYTPLAQEEGDLALQPLAVSRVTRWRVMKANSTPGRVGGTVKPGPLESSITVGFFEEHTHVPSGARIPTRHMAMDKIEMYGLYRAHFPALVRRAAELSEEKQEVHGGLCGFLKKSLVVANERPAWTQKSELDRRVQWYERKIAETRTNRVLDRCNGLNVIPTQEDPDNIRARSMLTFWRILKRSKVRFVQARVEHNCDIHKNADANKRELATAQDELAQMEKELKAARAGKCKGDVARLTPLIAPKRLEILKLEKDVEHARIHFIHYKTALKYVKGIEYNLRPNQVLLYRDFVNQYSYKGKKINNLIFVVSRPSPTGEGNIIDYVNNVAEARRTSAFHAIALDRLLKRGDLTPPGTELFISGDHGPHFWSWDTLMWQSTIFDKYKVKVEIVGMCSYHAYNRCDTHGANIKKIARNMSTKGSGPRTSPEFAALINNMVGARERGITV